MNMSEVNYLTFNHDRPLTEMKGGEVLEEYLYLFSGCADERAPRKDIKLGLCPQLQARKELLEKRITSAVDFHTVLMKKIS